MAGADACHAMDVARNFADFLALLHLHRQA